MSHMVIFRSADGKPGYHQAESLDEAIGFVEHLRNQEQVPDARIFRMEEIPIAVKTYYKVEVSPAQSSPAPASSAAVGSSAVAPSASASSPSSAGQDKITVPADDAVVVESMAPANGGPAGARFGRFNRS